MSKAKKIVTLTIGAVALLTILAVLSYAGFRYSGGNKAQVNSTTPFPYKGPEPVFGSIVSSTDKSVTVSTMNGKTQTISITPQTQIVSQVAAGEVGKMLSQIAAGTEVMVLLMEKAPQTALSVSIKPAPYQPATSMPLESIIGKLLTKKGNTLSIKTPASTTVEVVLTKSTVILSNVLQAQKAPGLEALVAGTEVNVVATPEHNGSLAALQLQLLIPFVK